LLRPVGIRHPLAGEIVEQHILELRIPELRPVEPVLLALRDFRVLPAAGLMLAMMGARAGSIPTNSPSAAEAQPVNERVRGKSLPLLPKRHKVKDASHADVLHAAKR
jgi:hypothetical protein